MNKVEITEEDRKKRENRNGSSGKGLEWKGFRHKEENDIMKTEDGGKTREWERG